MSDHRNKATKKTLLGRAILAVVQSMFTRKDTLLNRPLKAVIRFGVGLFHRLTGYMKDDIIEADIGFTAEELNQYQSGSKNSDTKQ